MNKQLWGIGLAALLALPEMAGATLIDRGSGLIFDDVLNITWLQDANFALTNQFGLTLRLTPSLDQFDCTANTVCSTGKMNWGSAIAWITGMNSANYLGFSDWRLPTISTIAGGTASNANFSNNATTDVGFAKTGTGWVDSSGNAVSEMGYMYYVNLGNLGGCIPNDSNPSGCLSQVGSGLTNSGIFTNLQSSTYWSGTESSPTPNSTVARHFNFDVGRQDGAIKNNLFFAWAVRSGDAAASVPEPGTMVLLGLGLAGIGFGKRSKRRL